MDEKWPYVANAVFRIVKIRVEWSNFRRFWGRPWPLW